MSVLWFLKGKAFYFEKFFYQNSPDICHEPYALRVKSEINV